MKYKILKGTELYKKLMELKAKMVQANKAANKVATGLGCKQWLGGEHGTIAGGLTGFEFEKQPDGWRKAWPGDYRNMYYPKNQKSNKEILDTIKALPVVTFAELNNVLGFEQHSVPFADGVGSRKRWLFHPGFQFLKDMVLVVVDEQAEYTPLPDMIEITVSEFNQLVKKPQPKKKNKEKAHEEI
jgi:hypothetical protein